MAVVVFLSAVSKEFGDLEPDQPQRFESYRYILERSLNRLGTGYQVIVQGTLAQGFGDLLQTLEEEVAKSNIIVHLVGEMAGASPQAASLRRLRDRHRDPELLADEPELAEAIGEFDGISFTQWEFYLAVEHRVLPLVFLAEPMAPRSPLMLTDDQQRASQAKHVQRLKQFAKHPESFAGQLDLALKVVTSVVRGGFGPISAVAPPSPETVRAARANAPEMVREIAVGLKRASKTAVQPHDPAGIEVYLQPVDTVALKHELDRRTALVLVQEQVDRTRLDCQANPTAANLYELAFAELAMGNYPAAISAARQSADLARAQMLADPEQFETHREQALNAFLTLSEAAQLANRPAESITALEEGGALIDQDREPVYWADFHQTLAEEYLTYAQYAQAESLILQIIDIREDHQGEADPALPASLLLWCRLLKIKANYQGEIGVAARAQRLFAGQIPLNLSGVSAALTSEALALFVLGRHREAEPLMRRALAISEQSYAAEHGQVARDLINLAALLRATNRLTEAEPLMHRALAILEQSYGSQHVEVAASLINLAGLLQDTKRLTEAELLIRRALAIFERSFGCKHPDVATSLGHLAAILRNTNRLEEAEPLMRRALAIREQSFGCEHPSVAWSLGNLAALICDTNRFEEAEPLLRRALAIDEQFYGAEHPDVAHDLNNLALLLQQTDRLAEAEPLMRRALVITIDCKCRTGYDHPSYQEQLGQYSDLLQAMKLPEVEVAQMVRDATLILGPLEPIVPEVERLVGPTSPVADELTARDRQ